MKNFYVRIMFWALNRKVFGGRTWYQYVEFNNKISNKRYCGLKGIERTASFQRWLSKEKLLQKNDVVLDLGSNAGYLSMLILNKVMAVYAVEIDRLFHKQAIFLSKLLLNKEDQLNLNLIRGDIFDKVELLNQVDVVVASKFFYHPGFNDRILDFMKLLNQSKVRLVIIQGHTVWGELGQEAGIKTLLEKHGFKYRDNVGGTLEYPMGVAERA